MIEIKKIHGMNSERYLIALPRYCVVQDRASAVLVFTREELDTMIHDIDSYLEDESRIREDENGAS